MLSNPYYSSKVFYLSISFDFIPFLNALLQNKVVNFNAVYPSDAIFRAFQCFIFAVLLSITVALKALSISFNGRD